MTTAFVAIRTPTNGPPLHQKGHAPTPGCNPALTVQPTLVLLANKRPIHQDIQPGREIRCLHACTNHPHYTAR
eukprot:15437260-Alexandrium_andersonii.AAC.1